MKLTRKRKILFSWSGGKDSALALSALIHTGEYEIVSLVCAIHTDDGRSTVHGLPMDVLQAQANSLGLPIHYFQVQANLHDYEESFSSMLLAFLNTGIEAVAFGDLEVSDIAEHREKLLRPFNLKLILPLWGKTSEEVMEEFLCSRIQAMIIVVQEGKLLPSNLGKVITRDLLEQFPPSIDICGELGEYHTVVLDAPIFQRPIFVNMGDVCIHWHTLKFEDGSTQCFGYHQAIVSSSIVTD